MTNVYVCPVCGEPAEEALSGPELSKNPVLDELICGDCDYLIGLGFANFEVKPLPFGGDLEPDPGGEGFYATAWVYDRLEEITGCDYVTLRDLWLIANPHVPRTRPDGFPENPDDDQ